MRERREEMILFNLNACLRCTGATQKGRDAFLDGLFKGARGNVDVNGRDDFVAGEFPEARGAVGEDAVDARDLEVKMCVSDKIRIKIVVRGIYTVENLMSIM